MKNTNTNTNVIYNYFKEVRVAYDMRKSFGRLLYGYVLDCDGCVLGLLASNPKYLQLFDRDNPSNLTLENCDLLLEGYESDLLEMPDGFCDNLTDCKKSLLDGFFVKYASFLGRKVVKDINLNEIHKLWYVCEKMPCSYRLSMLSIGVGQCCHCEALGLISDMEKIDGCYYCKTCSDNAVSCESCGRLIFADDTDTYNGMCLDCANGIGSDYVMGYHDFEDDGNDYIPRGEGDTYFGIELEFNSTEDDYPYIGADTVSTMDTKDLFHMEKDISISGFELISQPMSLDYAIDNKDYMQDILDVIDDSYKYVDSSTGFHVHINTSAFKDARAIARFITINAYFKNFLTRVARREPTEYCNFVKVPLNEYYDYIDRNTSQFNSHRTFINLHTGILANAKDQKTIEVRYFKSTFDADTIISTLKMLKVMVDLANKGGVVDSDEIFTIFGYKGNEKIAFSLLEKQEKTNIFNRMKNHYYYKNNMVFVIDNSLYNIIGFDTKTKKYILANACKPFLSKDEQKHVYRDVLKNISHMLIDKKQLYKEGANWQYVFVSENRLRDFNIVRKENINLI